MKRRLSRPSTPRPALRFEPTAWAKLVYLRDRGETEIGGFGVSAVDDPLSVIDIVTVRQRCTSVSVAFDDRAVADLFDRMTDEGIPPARFARIWVHTHPGTSAAPSGIDEETFQRVFGRTEWSVMAILAKQGETYARLSFHVGPGGAMEIPVELDFQRPFGGTEWEMWEQEYAEHVHSEPLVQFGGAGGDLVDDLPDDWFFEPWEWEENDDDPVELGSL